MSSRHPYSSRSPVFGASRSSIQSHGGRKCAVAGCQRSHCKRLPPGHPQTVEYSDFCEDHTCTRRLESYPRFCPNSTNSGAQLCRAHSTCSALGCTEQGRNAAPNVTLAWFCPAHRCSNVACISKRVRGRSECAQHLACSERNCRSIPANNSNFCSHHECLAHGCHQRATDAGHCEKHRTCHMSSCHKPAAPVAYFCTDHRCQIAQCQLPRGEASLFCVDHCCKAPECSASRQSLTLGDAAFCSLHECCATACFDLARDKGGFCSNLHSCAVVHCSQERSHDASRHGSGLCAEHFLDQTRRETAEYVETRYRQDLDKARKKAQKLEAELRQEKVQQNLQHEKDCREAERRSIDEMLEEARRKGLREGEEAEKKRRQQEEKSKEADRNARQEADRSSGDAVEDEHANDPEICPNSRSSQRQRRDVPSRERSRVSPRVYHYPAAREDVTSDVVPRTSTVPRYDHAQPDGERDQDFEEYYTYSSVPRQPRQSTGDTQRRQVRHSQALSNHPPAALRRASAPERVVYMRYITPISRRSSRLARDDHGVPAAPYPGDDDGQRHGRSRHHDADANASEDFVHFPNPREHLERPFGRDGARRRGRHE
ncbi:nucleoporin GLE1 [Microdochium nivale]|nr:nucleoporin GLE1 [Microdochium nivale]